MREGVERSRDTRELGAHAFAVVNDEADCDGSIAFLEYSYFLKLALFEDAKIIALEAGNKRPARVSNIHREQDKIHGHFDLRRCVRGAGRMLLRERRGEAEEANGDEQECKEQRSFAQMTVAGNWSQMHEETFLRRRMRSCDHVRGAGKTVWLRSELEQK